MRFSAMCDCLSGRSLKFISVSEMSARPFLKTLWHSFDFTNTVGTGSRLQFSPPFCVNTKYHRGGAPRGLCGARAGRERRETTNGLEGRGRRRDPDTKFLSRMDDDEDNGYETRAWILQGMKMFLDIVKTTRDDEAGAYKSGYSHCAPRPGHRKNKTDPKLSKWYTDYQDLERRYEADDTGWEFQSMRNKWRRRFRVPREVFHRLLDICRAKGLGVASGKGRPPHPLELKVMGCLRVLGRSACFDDLEDATFIDEETHRRFFHQFIAIFARGDTFAQWVSTPASQQEIMDVMSLYTLVGLSGCIGSIDCVHIPWGMCPAEDRSWFDNTKEGGPTVVYEVVANRARRILSVTTGFPGTRNDKTTCRFDSFVTSMRDGAYQHVEYPLYNLDGEATMCGGAYLICDGGKCRSLTHGLVASLRAHRVSTLQVIINGVY